MPYFKSLSDKITLPKDAKVKDSLRQYYLDEAYSAKPDAALSEQAAALRSAIVEIHGESINEPQALSQHFRNWNYANHDLYYRLFLQAILFLQKQTISAGLPDSNMFADRTHYTRYKSLVTKYNAQSIFSPRYETISNVYCVYREPKAPYDSIITFTQTGAPSNNTCIGYNFMLTAHDQATTIPGLSMRKGIRYTSDTPEESSVTYETDLSAKLQKSLFKLAVGWQGICLNARFGSGLPVPRILPYLPAKKYLARFFVDGSYLK